MDVLSSLTNPLLAAFDILALLKNLWFYGQIFIGFSFIIFVHELGHFAVAKWAGVRVEQFAIGFFHEIVGFTYGETRYSFNLLPLGGYVKMMGQEDFEVDTSGDLQYKDDPRSFVNKPVGHRMAIVSAGVIMNLVLAGVFFMIVFLVGKEVRANRVGAVIPDGPAARAGLQSDDKILSIEGTEIDEFNEINMAVMLAKPGKPLNFTIERDGKIKHLQIQPERSPGRDIFRIEVKSPQSAVIVATGPEYDLSNPHDPRPGDKIVKMGGEEVTKNNANRMINKLLTTPLDYPEVIVERPVDVSKEDSPRERVTVKIRPRLLLRRINVKKEPPPHLLGLVPLLRFSSVDDGGRADLAGIEVGDVILEWDGIENPTRRQISESIRKSAKVDPSLPERDIPLRVKRGRSHKLENLVVRPRVKIVPITGKRKPPTIHAEYETFADDELLVASVVPDVMGRPTPAAESGIPVNAVIAKVNGVDVRRWVDLAEQFRMNAGQTVTLTYNLGGRQSQECAFRVPQSLRTALGVGPDSMILAVNGRESVIIGQDGKEVKAKESEQAGADSDGAADETTHAAATDGAKSKKRSARWSVSQPFGLRAVLANLVGQTVEVKYRPGQWADARTANVTVTEEMAYPWVGVLVYTVDLQPGGETIILRKSNPIAALRVGVRKTYYFVVQVYQVMERMIFSRSLGAENISGPIGIVKMGSRMAEAGTIQLLFFLAIISANLAVINFLPLPIVDGGLMVFLIIEKIKGSPISVRIQVATQVVGLVLIISAFAFVTLMDLTR